MSSEINYQTIRKELLQMKDEDQSDSYSEEDAHKRATRLGEIITRVGWPSAELLGDDSAELAAFLIVQHSNDVSFQEQCLSLLKNLPVNSWQRKQSVAYLTDRILVNKGLPQVYGTQFQNGEPFPIEHPEQLAERRRDMDLEPFSEYRAFMQKRYRESLK